MADSSSRLSVVVASYDRGYLLKDCIGSLRAAGVPDLHIIVVDDGSRDDTRDVVHTLGRDIEYIYQENQGLSAARNAGIRAARTRYIAYLDSDDYWLPGVGSKLLDMLDRHPEIGAIFTDARVGNEKEGYFSWEASAGAGEFDDLPWQEPEPRLRLLDPIPLYRLMIRRNAVFTGAIVQRRELVLRAGLFDTSLKATGDWELWLRMLPLARFAYWPESLAIYTRHADNMTNNLDFMQQAFCETLERHAAKNGEWYRRDRALFDAVLRERLFYFGYSAYERRDYATAHHRFAAGLRRFPLTPRLLAYWAATCLPIRAVDTARRVRRTVA